MLRDMASSSAVYAVAAVLMMVTCLGCAPEAAPGHEVVEGPRGPFLPWPRARCIVYVVDRSGSIHKVFGLVQRQLLISISELTEEERFHVILPADGQPLEKEPKRLTPGIMEHKSAAAELLEGISAEGQTDPLPALRRAFEVLEGAPEEVKIIHLLSDGFPDNEAVLATIAELNGDGDVRVNTLVVGDDPLAHDVMKRIAEDNSGVCKHVLADE